MSENVIKLEGGFPWGFRMIKNDQMFKISSIIGNSKAQLSGLEMGDFVQEVNGKLIHGWTHEKLMDVIQSVEKLELKIQKKSNSSDQIPGKIDGSKYFNSYSTFKPVKSCDVINNNWYDDATEGTNGVYHNRNEYDSKWSQNVSKRSQYPKNDSSPSRNSYSTESADKSRRLDVTIKPENEKNKKEWYTKFQNTMNTFEPEKDLVKKTLPKWNAKDHEDPLCLNIIINKRTEDRNESFSKNNLDREVLEVTKPTLTTLRNIENYEPFDSENIRSSISMKSISLHQTDHENIADGKESTISWNTKSNNSVKKPDVSNKTVSSTTTVAENSSVKPAKHSFNQFSQKPHSEGLSYPHSRNLNLYSYNAQNMSRIELHDEDVLSLANDVRKVQVNGFKKAKVAKALQNYTGSRIEELSFKQLEKLAPSFSSPRNVAPHFFVSKNVPLWDKKEAGSGYLGLTNDFITITSQLNDQWYEGRLGVKKGLVPIKFVQLVKEQEKLPKVVKEVKRFTGNLEKIVNIYQKEGIRFIAVGDVEPRNSDELKLNIGEPILVMKIFDDGWMYGTSLVTNSSGLFLSKWVKLLED